jgi:hypothetical protein
VAVAARSIGSCREKNPNASNPARKHIARARGYPELTALQGSHEPATGWEPMRWGPRSSSASRRPSILTETKSWSEIPPELAIVGEEGGEAFRDLEGAGRKGASRSWPRGYRWGRERGGRLNCAHHILLQVGLSTLPAHLSVDDALIVTVSWLLSAEEARWATATLPGANRLARWPVGPGEASRRSGYRRQESCGDVDVGDRLSLRVAAAR